MAAELQMIRAAMAGGDSHGVAPRWAQVRDELDRATATSLSAEVERLLLTILSFDGLLWLDEQSPMPHRMSPENMLKSLALQALVRWTGTAYRPTMRRMMATADPALACLIAALLKKAATPKADGFSGSSASTLRTEETVSTAWTGLDLQTEQHEFGSRWYSERVSLTQQCGMLCVDVTRRSAFHSLKEATPTLADCAG